MTLRNYQIPLTGGLIVDNFAGGGGASEGIERALGRPVNIAVNHNPKALAMHQANHPLTKHYREDVWNIDPREVCAGRPVDLAWFSPDCKHFSKAKGGKPVEKKIRGLAWVALRWAATVKPRVIILENVEEFVTWGPVLEDGRPCPDRRGQDFRAFVNALRRQGYAVEWNTLHAHHFGAPTIRKRLFLVARCDGQPIVWPRPTHGPGLIPYRTAAECIDWSDLGQSIFERKAPLAENTQRRIAKGIKRYVLDAAQPFIVPIAHYNGSVHCHPIDEPLRTITAATKGGEFAVVSPVIVGAGGPARAGEPKPLDRPMGTLLTKNNSALVSAFLVKHFGGVVGTDVRNPMPTVLAAGTQTQLVTAHVMKMYGTAGAGQGADEPLHTVTTSGNHHVAVSAFLMKYYGTAVGQALDESLHTATAKDRFGLVTIHGEHYQIADIRMRMLTARELFRAQGFGEDYIINPMYEGKPLGQTDGKMMCGNSVSPYPAEALVRANCTHLDLAPMQPRQLHAAQGFPMVARHG